VAYRITRKKARRLQVDPLAPMCFAILHTAVGLALTFPMLIVLAIAQGVPLSPAILLFPIPAALMGAAGLVVALPLVLADVIYRDAQRSSRFLTTALFWTVPAVHLPPSGTILATIAQWNPLTPCFTLWRALLAGDVTGGAVPLVAGSIVMLALLVTLTARLFATRFWEALDYVQ
jgi:ABC-type polysaccharide/polyol phosphate export permease